MPAPNLQLVPDPARDALRAAIQAVAEAELSVKEAFDRQLQLSLQAGEANRRVIAARKAIESPEAKRDRGAAAMGDAIASRAIEARARELDAALAADAISPDYVALDEELTRRREHLHHAERRRRDAIAEVLRPLADQFLAQIRDLRQRALDLQRAYHEFPDACRDEELV